MKTLERQLIDRTLALAGVFQAAALVKHLSKTGRIQEPYFTASIESLFKIDAKNTPEIYGGSQHLTLGLNTLITFFSRDKTPKDPDIARYVLSLLHLERKLSKYPDMLQQIQRGIKRAQIQASHFNSTHDNVMANFSSIYTDTLSTFKFRIYVTGEALYLNQTNIMNKVRALLFAGIRSAVLWRQLGGQRWQLLISRGSILEAAQYCLKTREAAETF